jgi:hypothetical protein
MCGHTWLPRDPRPPIFGIALTHGALNPNPRGVFFPNFWHEKFGDFSFPKTSKGSPIYSKNPNWSSSILPIFCATKRQNLFKGKKV